MAIKTRTTEVFAFDENDKKQIINNLERLEKMFLASNCSILAENMEEYYDDVDFDTFARTLNIPFINKINDAITDYNENDVATLFEDDIFPWIKEDCPDLEEETRFTYEDLDNFGNIRSMSDSEALEYIDSSVDIDSVLGWIVNEGSQKFGAALRDEFVNWFVHQV